MIEVDGVVVVLAAVAAAVFLIYQWRKACREAGK